MFLKDGYTEGMEERKKAAICIRVSTEEQKVKGHSFEEQERQLRKGAEYRGYDLPDEYVLRDQGSGKDTNRDNTSDCRSLYARRR